MRADCALCRGAATPVRGSIQTLPLCFGQRDASDVQCKTHGMPAVRTSSRIQKQTGLVFPHCRPVDSLCWWLRSTLVTLPFINDEGDRMAEIAEIRRLKAYNVAT